jgi:hypothetical protein
MKAFGEFDGYESEIYAFEISHGMLLEALIVPRIGGTGRDFVLVPERKLVEAIRNLRGLGYSKILEEHFTYVAPEGMAIDLQVEFADNLPDEGRHVRFAVVRWNRNCIEEFPPELTCVARVAGAGSGPLNRSREVIPAAPKRK